MTDGVFDVFVVWDIDNQLIHSIHTSQQTAQVVCQYANKIGAASPMERNLVVTPGIPVDQFDAEFLFFGYEFWFVMFDEHGEVVDDQTKAVDPYYEDVDEVQGVIDGRYWCFVWAKDRGDAVYRATMLRSHAYLTQRVT